MSGVGCLATAATKAVTDRFRSPCVGQTGASVNKTGCTEMYGTLGHFIFR